LAFSSFSYFSHCKNTFLFVIVHTYDFFYSCCFILVLTKFVHNKTDPNQYFKRLKLNILQITRPNSNINKFCRNWNKTTKTKSNIFEGSKAKI